MPDMTEPVVRLGGRRPGARRTPPRRCTLRPDDEGEVVATLVHRPAEPATRKAVLHVHGFADYFFQTGMADFWVEHGYDFYALDLRKYGRSLRPHQTPNYVADLRSYYEELDLAHALVAEDHDHVVFSAHSTGGLTVPLWLHDRGLPAAGVFLNAPWIDMHGDAFTRLMALPVDPPARRALPDARDPARGQRRLRPQPAPRLPRRVGLRPRWKPLRPGRCTPAGSAPSAPDRRGSPAASRSTPPC